ncbi:uncharacterized protein BJ212DRAFT_1296450 [Suillus subaureus]|uniref:DUF6532 domain-containing protein n=1 Tax=Suillus subaureus TaxID=48587 RepID=A0A9P7EL39_9AGAM|nr:uncharacterized protein BJ212DRAFT_1296450 [Suillus subaureus]KAG1823932.1 hypothetical protein BJ212DRAFT_1296450 [Suillus subaureus]
MKTILSWSSMSSYGSVLDTGVPWALIKWYKLIRSKGPSHAITFQEVLDLLDNHLATLPKELSPELLFAWKVLKGLPVPNVPVTTTAGLTLTGFPQCLSQGLKGHPGVGKEGRNTQLEQLDAIMDAPVQASQPKGSNSFDSTVPVNPVAPKPPCKGHGEKATPSPYHISEQLISNAMTPNVMTPNVTIPNAKIPRAHPKTKTIVPPPLSMAAVNSQPTPIQCKDGEWFRFSPHIVPPGMEPDLKALNNSFMAAAEVAHILSTSNASQCQLPGIVPNAFGSCLVSGEDSSQMVFLRMMTSITAADDHFYQNLDPALWPTASQSTESKSSNSSEGESSSDNDSKDEQIGWGGIGGHHSTHPGFSGEGRPSQPQVVSTLPPDFEFQYSCDEDDQVAEKNLVVDSSSSDSDVSMDVRSTAEVAKSSVKSKEVGGPSATQLGWYGPHWKSFLEDAKGECCAQQALENPFLKLVEDLPISITESLSASLIKWLKNGGQIEPRHLPDMWPAHKADMARLLYDDLATWCLDLKKIAIMPSAYNLVPSSTIPIQQCTTWIENTATDLLEVSMYLHNGVDELGETRNFAHLGLCKAAIVFLYTGPYHIAHWQPNIFRKEIPLTCLALVCTVLNCIFDGLVKNGNRKSFPKFTAKEYEPIYKTMLQLLQTVMEDLYHSPRLVQQLHAWAEARW